MRPTLRRLKFAALTAHTCGVTLPSVARAQRARRPLAQNEASCFSSRAAGAVRSPRTYPVRRRIDTARGVEPRLTKLDFSFASPRRAAQRHYAEQQAARSPPRNR